MKVCLLYKDIERKLEGAYYDTGSIIQDLGLKALYLAAAKKVIYENGEVKKVEKEDPFLMETLRGVMMIPCISADEIEYRQAVMADCFKHEDLVRDLYSLSSEVLNKWFELGRGPREKMNQANPAAKLMADIRVIRLFCESLSRIKEMLAASENNFSSTGICNFRSELLKAFSDEREEFVRRVLSDVTFYTDRIEQKDDGSSLVVRPKIVMECGLEDGLKFSSLKLHEVSSEATKFYRRGGVMSKIQGFINSWTPDSFSTVEDVRINDQSRVMEHMVAAYLTDQLKGFMDEFQNFFDALKYQTAFYLAAIQLKTQMERFGVNWCFPKVSDRRDLEFEDLKEFVMALEQRVEVIGNTCSLKGKDLLIVTGANQGGKSTFLRSIGIAQVMMQCGLPVAATSYSAGVFPRIFVHFTRREDSEMNSGRLDEELNRMNKIVEQIGDGSLLLLNESFATTTEKEGSVIAYDIIKALKEAGVRILTVTHLLSFARRVHEESKNDPDSGVEFLSAERKEDGTRTFRMIRHEPELTSFGLDLFAEMVERKINL